MVGPERKMFVESNRWSEIPRAELARYLSVFSSELESVTLLMAIAPPQDQPLTAYSIHSKLIAGQGSNPGWVVARSTTNRVIDELITGSFLTSNQNRMSLTDEGRERGVPLARLLLEFSSKFSPITLRDFISTSPDLTERELVVYRAVLANNGRLSREEVDTLDIERPYEVFAKIDAAGVATYKRDVGKGIRTRYFALGSERVDMPTKTDSRYTQLAGNIITIARELFPDGQFTSNDIIDQYLKLHSELDEKGISAIRQNISRVMTDLLKARFVEVRETEGSVILSPMQLEQLREFNRAVTGFQEGDPEIIRDGIEFATRVVNDPVLLALLMKKANQGSVMANVASPDDTKKYILDIIKNSGEDGLSTEELERLFRETGVIRRERGRVTKMIRIMEREGVVERRGLKIYPVEIPVFEDAEMLVLATYLRREHVPFDLARTHLGKEAFNPLLLQAIANNISGSLIQKVRAEGRSITDIQVEAVAGLINKLVQFAKSNQKKRRKILEENRGNPYSILGFFVNLTSEEIIQFTDNLSREF